MASTSARYGALLLAIERAAAADSTNEAASKALERLFDLAAANPGAAIATGLVSVGCLVMLGGSLKGSGSLERDASGGTGATFDSYANAGKMLSNKDSVLAREKVNDSMEAYSELFSGKTGKMGDIHANAGSLTTEESIKKRQEGYRTMVNNFYDLVTDFYEYGWCQSFHFGPRWRGETFLESIKRAEYHLCSRLHLAPGKKVLDVGCGVGGPMRNMAIFSGATFEGITINEYQVGQKRRVRRCRPSEEESWKTRKSDRPMPWRSRAANAPTIAARPPNAITTCSTDHRARFASRAKDAAFTR